MISFLSAGSHDIPPLLPQSLCRTLAPSAYIDESQNCGLSRLYSSESFPQMDIFGIPYSGGISISVDSWNKGGAVSLAKQFVRNWSGIQPNALQRGVYDLQTKKRLVRFGFCPCESRNIFQLRAEAFPASVMPALVM